MPVLPDVASTTVWPGFKRAASLGVVDDREREPVLDRRQRIERLDLHVDRDVLRRNPVQLDDGRVADRVEDAFVDHGAALLVLCR